MTSKKTAKKATAKKTTAKTTVSISEQELLVRTLRAISEVRQRAIVVRSRREV
jgi:hypothetical protein